jgi:hypothetical protein
MERAVLPAAQCGRVLSESAPPLALRLFLIFLSKTGSHHRNSGVPEFRTMEHRQSDKRDLRYQVRGRPFRNMRSYNFNNRLAFPLAILALSSSQSGMLASQRGAGGCASNG